MTARGGTIRDALLLAVALACVVALALLTERRAAQTDVTYSTYDASPGGYRAWYELLAREGLPAQRFERRAVFLDGSTQAIVVADPPATDASLRAPEAEAFATWVRSGGSLFALGDGAIVSALRSALKLPRATAGGVAPTRELIGPMLRAAGVRRLAPVTRERLVARTGDTVLAADPKGILIVRYRYGRGTVTAAIDAAAFSNAEIATPDHARLAVALVGAAGPAFDEAVHGYLTPEHWWIALPAPFVGAVFGACLVLAIAVVGAAIRLGPPIEGPPARAATSAEYVDAVASLYQRARARRKALGDALESTKRHVARNAGGSDSHGVGSPAYGALSELEDICARGAIDDAALVRGVALAVSVRKDLATHGSRS